MASKIAIFGGTFNPVHNGHIAIATAALEEMKLDKVVFMPNGNPPHKSDDVMPDAHHRYNMTALAIRGIKDFEISDYEAVRTEPSYTVDTQRVMKQRYASDVYFIIGADSFYSIDRWKSPQILKRECRFIVADRTCTLGDGLAEACRQYNAEGGCAIPLSMPRYDITSTHIRELVSRGKDASMFVPEAVFEYMMIHKLYQS